MKQLGFYIDLSSCVGCKTCELACKDRKNLPMGVRIRRVREYGGGTWKNQDGYLMPDGVYTYFVAAACMHCSKPACVEVCPTGAMTKNKDNGIVAIDRDVCIGCGSCIDACPYDAPSLNEEEEKMYKCDLCMDKLAEGMNPECVDACLQRCIKVDEVSKLQKDYKTKLNEAAPLADASLTDPSLVLRPHRYTQKPGSTNGKIINTTEL